tara:strand:+ start:994 stop:1149 length:156 start_codon:yes stop_codon:yes gene_type:complete
MPEELILEFVGEKTVDAIAEKKPVKVIAKYWNIITIVVVISVGIYSYILLS